MDARCTNDLSKENHRIRNLHENVAWLVAQGSSLAQALDHLGVSKNAYEKQLERR